MINEEKKYGWPLECYQCKLNKYIYNTPVDESIKAEYIRKQEELLKTIDENIEPVAFVDMLSKEYDKNVPPYDYAKLKVHFNELMMKLVPTLEEKMDKSDDPMLYALKLAFIANYIDFGTLDGVSEERLLEMLEEADDRQIDMDVYDDLNRELEAAKSLVYFTDNCGEVVLDKLFIKQISKRYPNVKITALVRGAEVINDASMVDAKQIGLDEVCEVRGNGLPTYVTDFDKMPADIREIVEDADLMISKGQANGESFKGNGYNIYYILLCKCERFARLFNAKKWDGILAKERQ